MCYCATHEWLACHRCVVLTQVRKLKAPVIDVDVCIRCDEQRCDIKNNDKGFKIEKFPDKLSYHPKLLKQQNMNVFLEGSPPFAQFAVEQSTLPESIRVEEKFGEQNFRVL